jgi:hypothetical protein
MRRAIGSTALVLTSLCLPLLTPDVALGQILTYFEPAIRLTAGVSSTGQADVISSLGRGQRFTEAAMPRG